MKILIALWAKYAVRQYLIPAAIGAAVSVLVVTHYQAYKIGQRIAAVEFAKALTNDNAKASQNAEDWRGAYRRCVERGGLYDFERNRCDG
ncbi:MAG TPA: hypothetical protein PK205_06970 [Promineifilum sp.]|nr:hypothetical protein [Promineifilum sp.]